MNYLSNKLARAIQKPILTNLRAPSALNPSAASVVTNDGRGGFKVVGACHRQQFYRITGHDPDESVEKNIDWTLSAMIGDKMHELLADIIDTYGFAMGIQRLATEHSIYDKSINLRGRSDLIVWDHNTNEPAGVEIKSLGEYKAKSAMEQPIEEHILQSVVYLDFYNKNIPDDQKKIKKWYIWYISRTENWSVKSKAHNSDFTMLWDYLIELDNGVPIVQLNNGTTQRWTNYSIDNIYNRYNDLITAVTNNQIPPRDYEIIYSEERVAGMYKSDQLTRKADKEAVERWLKKGAPEGKLKVEMGDFECVFCEFSRTCWEGLSNIHKKTFSNLPSSEEKKPEKKSTFFL